ncbi:MAG: hypothetical protein J2O38_08660, partial [Acidimicrobiales bacterium]|nr:hypothetical protein [Acidimicrobiales bacterium]
LGLIREADGVGAQVLTALGANLTDLRANVEGLLDQLGAEKTSGGRAQPLRRRLWPKGMVPADPPRTDSGMVEISFGKFSQTIADPELAAAMSQISPDQLHTSLRQAVLGAGSQDD